MKITVGWNELFTHSYSYLFSLSLFLALSLALSLPLSSWRSNRDPMGPAGSDGRCSGLWADAKAATCPNLKDSPPPQDLH